MGAAAAVGGAAGGGGEGVHYSGDYCLKRWALAWLGLDDGKWNRRRSGHFPREHRSSLLGLKIQNNDEVA